MPENKSEVAQLLERIDQEYSAAQQALTGLAVTASHEAITARMEIGADRILQLVEEGKHEEAQNLMNTPNWGVEESEEELPTDQTITKAVEECPESNGTVGPA